MIPTRTATPLAYMLDYQGPEEPVVPIEEQVIPIEYYEHPDFISYMKNAENADRTGYDPVKKLWFPHTSPEGGNKTIAYGYKLKDSDDFSKGITEEQANELLNKQLRKFDQKMQKELGAANYKKLKKNDKDIGAGLDITYNTGSSLLFPNFFKALLRGDRGSALSESKRYYKKNGIPTELTRRNKLFKNQFFND